METKAIIPNLSLIARDLGVCFSSRALLELSLYENLIRVPRQLFFHTDL